jgi:protein phosphatase
MIATISPRQATPEAPISPQPFAARSFGLSDPGRVRPANEDHFLVLELPGLQIRQTGPARSADPFGGLPGYLFLVADGMGGHPAGEAASGLAAEAVQDFFQNARRREFRSWAAAGPGPLRELEGAFLHAHARVVEEAALRPERRSMGTTLTAALAVGRKLFVAHAGHSRCYLFSRGGLRQVTQDHTVAAEMACQGLISPQEATRHSYRHFVTNILQGANPSVRVELHESDLRAGDVLLLCSDGLTEMVSAERIAAVLGAEREPRRACERLVAEANGQGGTKNITVVVARIEVPEGQEEPTPAANGV